MVIPLSNIEPGTKAEVVWIASPPPMAARLDGLGFSPREIVSCVLKKGRRGMRAYLVRGAVIALRRDNAREIFVRPLPEEDAPAFRLPGRAPESSGLSSADFSQLRLPSSPGVSVTAVSAIAPSS